MFTGIIEELGRVRAVESNSGGARLEVGATIVTADASVGDSIAVDGCCLTVVEREHDRFSADAVIETLARTTLGSLRPGDRVNLERPIRLSDRLGGHLVQGHVDGVGHVVAREALADGSTCVTFSAPAPVLRYVVEKGSVAVDGVSLTVTGVDGDRFTVAVIPHTLEVTSLGTKAPGAPVNLEVDLVAKYVERLLAPTPKGT